NLAEKWEKEFHEFDKRRNSLPWETYVYNLGNFVGTQLIITSSYDLEEALEENEFVKKNLGLLKREKMELIKKFKTDNVSCACATNSLQQLKGDVFYYAGFPWFLQYWSRDQLVSLGAIIQQHDFEAAKEIIFTYLKHITKDGRLPNRIPPADLQSADSIGWLWKRVEDFLIELKIKKLTEYYLDESDMGFLADRLEHCISLLEKNHCEQGLLFSRAKETWMDTTEQEGSDTRIGARIELQAMMSQMNKLAYFLTRNQIYQTKEIELRDKVRRLFFNGEILKDGAFDPTQRPNIFIAHYIYPELLSNDEWKIVFIKNLERTWLEWGGLASISKKHPLFQPAHTGENNRSYHRGDSWFWLNNLAAICLHRVDKKLFSGYIKKIKQASEQEILFHGFIGANAEISSASKLESFGCWNQFWSNAMFIELCNELK
ncbi:MAG: amylo-alpha-1,6-glucosidase, partial [Candidatus Woesearchaeota archaeon]